MGANKAWQHFKLISKHRKYVRENCFVAGLYWRGVTHDLSKYSPTEFIESVKYFSGSRSPIDTCKEANGVSKAWMHHKGRNKHHYEYWMDNFDKGGHPVQMPFKDATELVCDYLGAGRAYLKENFSYKKEYDWWKNKKSLPLAMHPQTKAYVELMLCTMAHRNDNSCLKHDEAKYIYNIATALWEMDKSND